MFRMQAPDFLMRVNAIRAVPGLQSPLPAIVLAAGAPPPDTSTHALTGALGFAMITGDGDAF